MEDFFLGFGLLGIIVGIAILVFYIWSIVWAYNDAERRGKSGILIALIVAFVPSWPLGLIIWLLIRPRNQSVSR